MKINRPNFTQKQIAKDLSCLIKQLKIIEMIEGGFVHIIEKTKTKRNPNPLYRVQLIWKVALQATITLRTK